MDITFKKKLLTKINSVYELENFIKEKSIYKFFKKFHLKYHNEINQKINDTKGLPYKQLKPWIKSILQYPETIYNYNFLYSMGWEDLEIKSFIIEKQKHNSSILSKNKFYDPEKYYDKTTSRIEYWIKKGYSNDEAKKLLSERQSTFSLKKCIEKYGEVDGVKKFEDRQNKWISSLKIKENYLEIQKTKNSYKEKTIVEKINQTTFTDKTKEIILNYLTGNTLDEFTNKIIKSIDIKRYSDIQPFFNSKLIQNHFGVTSKEIKNSFYEKIFYNLKKQTYGVPVYHNGIRFKSIKEYQIAIFLDSNGIIYIYEKNYPNSNFKFDFYIPKLDLYIEYYGMLDGKNIEKLNSIQMDYKNKIEVKNLYCEKNNLYLIQDVNYNSLINKLKKII